MAVELNPIGYSSFPQTTQNQLGSRPNVITGLTQKVVNGTAKLQTLTDNLQPHTDNQGTANSENESDSSIPHQQLSTDNSGTANSYDQVANSLNDFGGQFPNDLTGLLNSSAIGSSLTSEHKDTLQNIGGLLQRATSLSERTNTAGSNELQTLVELTSVIHTVNDIVFASPPAPTIINGLGWAAALITVNAVMSTAAGNAVTNAQKQVTEMNAFLAQVQNMVTPILQLASKLQLYLNSITSLAGSQSVTPPSDVNVQSNKSSADAYAQATTNSFYPATGQWQNVNGVTPIGMYALSQAGVAFVDFADSYDFNSGDLDPMIASIASTIPNPNASACANVVNGTGQTGINLAFVVTNSDTGPNIPGSLSLPSTVFNLIPPQYLAHQACTISYNNTDTDLPNSYVPTNDISPNQVAYLPMGALSQLFENVLTVASTFLPTEGMYTTVSAGLGGPFPMPPTSSIATDTSVTSAKSLGNLTQTFSQMPSNLNPTIANYTQQINALVQGITQLAQTSLQTIRDLPHSVQS